MKKAIVLAGGCDQIALIEELHKRGYYCVLIDYYDDPPAKKFADAHIKGSTLDTELVKKIAVEQKADLIVTACTDQALLTMAKVSEELGLPSYLDYKTALNVTNKIYMKDIMQKFNIPTSRHLKVQNFLEKDLVANWNFPLVVKPADCNSSKGVKKVNSEKELILELEKALNYSRTHSAIIEEFIEGRELSADFYIDSGEVKLLSVTESTKIPNHNSFTIMQSLYPVTDEATNQKIIKIAERIAEVFQLNNCPLLIQLIDTGNDVFVIEFSARMGGGSKYKLIETISGVDIMNQYVNLVLGDVVDINPKLTDSHVAINYIYCNPGILSDFKNFDCNKESGKISDYFLYKTPGMSFEKAETSGDRAAGFIVMGATKEDLNELIQECDRNLEILNPEGKDIMIHNLYK